MSRRILPTLSPATSSVVKRDRFYPPRDRQGKVIPHHLETIGFLKAVPHALSFFNRRVPPEFWIEETDGEGPMITVACRCGEEPVLRFNLRSYSIAECSCGRFFLHDGTGIRVGYDEEKLPAPDPEPAEPEEPEVEDLVAPPEEIVN